MPYHGPAQTRGPIVDSGALACRIDAYLGATPELELSRHMFYVLASTFAQLSGGRPLPLEPRILEPQHSIALQDEGRDRSLRARAGQTQWPYNDAGFPWVHGDDGAGPGVPL